MIISVLAIVCLTAIAGFMAHENRRLTNLLLSKNPSAVIAAEKTKKHSKKSENPPATRAAWTTPVEAVGP